MVVRLGQIDAAFGELLDSELALDVTGAVLVQHDQAIGVFSQFQFVNTKWNRC